MLKHVFDGVRLGLRLSHYRVIPTRTGARLAPGGILEVVPDVRSRDEIGKVRRGASEGVRGRPQQRSQPCRCRCATQAGFPTLYEYFLSCYGRPDGAAFEEARRNLVRSLAAYAVFCYLLQVRPAAAAVGGWGGGVRRTREPPSPSAGQGPPQREPARLGRGRPRAHRLRLPACVPCPAPAPRAL